MDNECAICPQVASAHCPRCKKPLCEAHGTPHTVIDPVTRIQTIWQPDEECRVPLEVRR
jgi:hypothetical protein